MITLELPELHTKQKLVHKSKARFKILSCGRQWGKTSLVYVMAIECAVAGGTVWWVAPVASIANIGWRLLVANLKDVPEIDINITERRILIPGGGEIWVKSADNPDNLRGPTLDLLIVDEAAYIKDTVWDMVLRPTLAIRQGKAIFISTPNGVGNYFHELFTLGQDKDEVKDQKYQSWCFPSSSNPYMPVAEVEEQRKRLPKIIFEQEWLGKFVADGRSVFKNIDDLCVLQTAVPIPGDYYVAGIDWGSKFDPTVVCVVHAQSRKMVALERFHEEIFENQYATIEAVCSKYNVGRILVEENTIGIAPFQALQARGLPVVPFVTTNQTKFDLVNKMIHAMDTRKVELLDDEILKNELKIYEATRTPNGMWRYAAKGKGHDDTVMAMLLAYGLITTEEIYVPSQMAVAAKRKAVLRDDKINYKERGGAFPLTHGYR